MAAIDAAVIRVLQQAVGEKFVVHRPEDLMVYEYDGTIDRGRPQCVVLPDSATQVAAVVKLARRHGIPLTPRGAGTGLSGGALAVEGGILLGTARLRRILEVDVENRLAIVEPGVVNVTLSSAVAPYGLFYAPDPSSQKACTIGGNVAENSGGPHCLALGVTTNHVLGCEVVTADGEIMWLGGRTFEAPGYDLRAALVGSEGTLAVVTKAAVRLLPLPEEIITLLAPYDTVEQASQAVSAIIGAGIIPAAVEMLDRLVIQAANAGLGCGYPDDAGAVLLVEVDGLREQARETAAAVRALLTDSGAREIRQAEDPAARELLWKGRKGAIGALGRIAPNYYILDGVVPRSRLPQVMGEVTTIAARYGFPVANVFHAGDGNLHPNLLFDERVPGATERVLEAGAEIMDVCVKAGGALTGEHGIGLEKQRFMPWVYSDADLENMARLRQVFASDGFLNPGKVIPSAGGCGEVAHQQAALVAAGPDSYI
jgi:glycolate oxidase